MLSKREMQFLKLCLLNEKLNLEYVLSEFKISLRMLQYNLNNINFWLVHNNLDKIVIKQGYINYNIKDIEKFLEINLSSLTKEDKVNIIKLYLLFNENGLNITKLSKKINLSRNTIKTYMNELNEELKYVHIKGYFLEKTNIEKSKILSKLLGDAKFSFYINDTIDEELLLDIKEFIAELSNSIELNLSESTYLQVISYMYCIIKYEEKDENLNNIINTDETKLIEKLINKYFYNTSVSNQIIDLFIGLSITLNIDSWINESFWVGKVIKTVSNKIKIDLTVDRILYDFLLSHIKVAMYRMKNNILLDNTIYRDLILKNDEIIDLVTEAIKDMEEEFQIKFSKDEISLLAFHFKASIERLNVSSKKRVILVCGMGYGTSKLLEYKLKEIFDIDIVAVLPVHLLDTNIINFENVDYILTTTDLDIDAIKINPKLKAEDYQKLESLGIKRNKNKIEVNSFLEDIDGLDKKEIKKLLLNKYNNIFYAKIKKSNGLIDLLTEDRVIFKKEVKDWKEAINILGENLEKLNATNGEYKKQIIKNIENLGPYIVIENEIAIPHAGISDGVFRTDFSFLILEKPVKFGNEKEANFFFIFSSTNKEEHIEILNDFYNIILNKDFINKIPKINNYNILKKYIKEGGDCYNV